MTDLAVLTTYFNPSGYHSRRRNLHMFRERLRANGVALLTIECAFGSAPFALPMGADVVQVRARDVLWQKERLLNLIIAQLPRHYTKVAWLDCDILFADANWASETSNALDHHALVQPFGQVLSVALGSTISAVGEELLSFAAVACQDADAARSDDWKQHGHTGYAWAARREVLERLKLYDRFVLGGADHAMAHSWLGDFASPCLQRRWQANPLLREDFLRWAEPMARHIEGQIGYLPGKIFHLWHGSQRDRRYEQRHVELAQHGFNPAEDLRLGPSGCWQWATAKPAMHAAVAGYFSLRDEDREVGGL